MKVGDKVRCIQAINENQGGPKFGEEFTLTSVGSSYVGFPLSRLPESYSTEIKNGTKSNWGIDCFELIEEKNDLGTKHDSSKPMMRFLTREFLEQTAQAHTYGAKKYGDFNFKKGIETLRLYDACIRHLLAWSEGEDNDPESGDTHLGHAAANLNMLMWMLENKPELDNRYNLQKDKNE